MRINIAFSLERGLIPAEESRATVGTDRSAAVGPDDRVWSPLHFGGGQPTGGFCQRERGNFSNGGSGVEQPAIAAVKIDSLRTPAYSSCKRNNSLTVWKAR